MRKSKKVFYTHGRFMEIKHLLQLARFRDKNSPIIGLDISPDAIKMVEISVEGSSFFLQGYGSLALRPNTFSGNRINDLDMLADSIKKFSDILKPSSKQVVIAIPDNAIISKMLHIPEALTNKEIEEFIFIEAPKYIPYSVNEINLDFQIIAPLKKDPSLLEVLVVASRTEYVRERVDAVRNAGFEVFLVDVASYAIARSVQKLRHIKQNKLLLIIECNEEQVQLLIFQEMKLIYSREERLSTEHIELVLVWIKRNMHFFYSTSTQGFVDEILLTGSLATLPGLVDLIQEELAVLTTMANPFSSMLLAKNLSLNKVAHDAPAFMLSTGLALRGIASYDTKN